MSSGSACGEGEAGGSYTSDQWLEGYLYFGEGTRGHMLILPELISLLYQLTATCYLRGGYSSVRVKESMTSLEFSILLPHPPQSFTIGMHHHT